MRARLALAGIALALAGCATTAPSPTATATPTATGPTTPPPPTASNGPVVIDPSLLDHLPLQVDGLDVMRRSESDLAAAADPVVTEFGEGVVTGLAIDPASGDFAYATLVRLRPGVFTDDLYRSWRDSFDEGACSQAGGVVRSAITEISGRDVHIDSCEGGVRTYHVWLEKSRVLVSISSLGERRLGELLVEGIRD
ncbi:MAG: hypothetical protein WEF51_02410 [Chloroflexota bacterium]